MTYTLSDFDFYLPPEAIAQNPAEPRDSARLLQVVGRVLHDRRVADLPGLLREGDVLVVNNSKVIPARLFGRRGAVEVEILLHHRLDGQRWEAFARPLRRLQAGQAILFADDFSAKVEQVGNGLLVLSFDREAAEIPALLERYGLMPLPPYIRREKEGHTEDRTRYQTVYAKEEGSVAAPTAGLHFTPELLAQLKARGVQQEEVTLHVGAGTFQPVKTENIAEHVMHAEVMEVASNVAARINRAKKEGRRIIAVGTTAARVLESRTDERGVLQAGHGETRLFITPGYRFKMADALITNFHLPKSTLLMLVAALAGRERILAAYQHAIKNGYRFYSYGDACFVEP